MAGISLSGLASNLDTATMVDQLMAIERKPQTRLKTQQMLAEARKSALADISTKLGTVRSAAAALRATSLWEPTQTVESSNAAVLTARRLSGAGPGGYPIQVQSLATAEQRTYAYTKSATPGTITIGSASIEVVADASLQTVVDAINSSSSAPVYAAAVNDQLVLSARTTGSASTFTASGATIAEDLGKKRLGTNAVYSLDGGTTWEDPSQTNVLKGVVPGVEITLKGIGSASVNVSTPGVDATAVSDKVKAFVDAYNTALDAIRAKLTEKKVANATTDSDLKKGILFGDTMLTGVLGQLRDTVAGWVNGVPPVKNEMAALGVDTPATSGSGKPSADALAGRLVFSADKLAAALASDPAGVKKTLGATLGVDGFAQKIETLLGSTRVGGLMDMRVEETDKQVSRVKTAIADWDTRLKGRETRLKAQFTALETALSSNQTQQQWLTGQINALSR